MSLFTTPLTFGFDLLVLCISLDATSKRVTDDDDDDDDDEE